MIEQSFSRAARASRALGASLLIGTYTTPATLIWEMDAGTTEMPSSAATKFATEVICGASWLSKGSKPARRQAVMISSKRLGPAARGKSTNGSFAKVESAIILRFAKVCPEGTTATMVSPPKG